MSEATIHQRGLSRLERAMVATDGISPFNIAAEVTYRGPVAPDELLEAAGRLASDHEALRWTLSPGGGGWMVSDQLPELSRTDGDVASLLARGLSERFDHGQPLWSGYASALPDGNGVSLVLVCSHLLCDGSALLALFQAIGSLCAGIEPDRRNPPLDLDHRWPEPGMRKIAHAAGAFARQEWRYRRRRRHVPASHPDDACRIVDYTLPAEDVAAVDQAARREGLMLHSVLQAAHVAAIGARLTASACLRGIAFADLRRRIAPQAPPNELGAAIVMIPFLGRPKDDMPALASEIQKTLSGAQKDGSHYGRVWLSPVMMAQLAKRGNERMADVALSWSGRVPAWRAGDVRIERIRAFISPTRVGPVWGAWGYRDDAGAHFCAASPAVVWHESEARAIALDVLARLRGFARA